MLRRFCRNIVVVAGLWLCLLPGARAFDHDHGAFTTLLQPHVADGRVNYSGLVEQQAALDRYLDLLNSVSTAEIDGWSRPQQLAFWINAYNALALDTVIAHYPLKRRGLMGFAFPSSSIRQIADVWNLERRSIGGEPRSLDEIEHGIIRATFKEPRIHFALVCAAVSCPKLRPEAYRAEQLETQLAEQVTEFLADANKGLAINTRRKRILVSSIFDWFQEDFALPNDFSGELAGSAAQAGVVYFISNATARAALRSGEYRVGYLKYDWTLNEQ